MAACVAAIFALSTPAAIAITLPITRFVTSCSDAGTGSLRATVAASNEGDTVSMVELPTTYGCSTITLSTGAIAVSRNKLTLLGPGSGVTITGKYGNARETDRVINHTGTGTVYLEYLTITEGLLYSSTQTEKGGCIYSKGNVYLKHTTVSTCSNNAGNHYVEGGGIYTVGGLTAQYSTITGNGIGSATTTGASGGGAFVGGDFTARFSTISGNTVGGALGYSGALVLRGNVTIFASTISGNTASNGIGGIFIAGYPGDFASITDSTISGNIAQAGTVGGVLSQIPISLSNSTIAFNQASTNVSANAYYAPGLALNSFNESFIATLQSSLISNNSYDNFYAEDDVSALNQNSHTVTVSGTNNLVGHAHQVGVLPSGTLTDVCALLGPLRNNGGPTQTHALLSQSPGIDQGNNIAGLFEDQRGLSSDTTPYPYPRISGNTPDIGAYEVQKADIVFNSSFDGCVEQF